jgi:hypothetical protein
MEKIPCPICTRLNDPQENRCWFCSAELHPDVSSPGGDDVWLSGMKEDLGAGNSLLNDKTLDKIEEVTPSEDIPDWLARIREREAAERAQRSIEEEKLKVQKKSQSGIPDWLSTIGEGVDLTAPVDEPLPVEIRNEGSEQAPSSIENETINPIEGEGDWLESLKSWQSSSSQENPAESDEIAASEIETSEIQLSENNQELDIGGSFEAADAGNLPVVESGNEETNNVSKSEIDDSVAFNSPELEQKDQIAQVFEGFHSQVEPEDIVIPDFNEDAISSEEVEPALPSEIIAGGVSINDVLSNGPLVTSGAGESVSDTSLDTTEIIPTDAVEEKDSSEPFKPDELPDWLIDEQPMRTPDPELKPADAIPSVDDNLLKPEKANLPIWLDAMRPVEAVELAPIKSKPSVIGKSNDIVAAMETVVAGGKLPQVSGKPSDLGGGLKVTEHQRAHAALLSTFITNIAETTEGENKTIQSKKYVIWRAFLALVFFALAVLGFTYLNGYGLQPALFPEEVVHTFDQINSLPLDKPVLIAGDYEAGLAGEIRWSSQPLIEHLMRRNLAIALISTNPVDTALLTAQITKGLRAVPDYLVLERVVDLGYLPGGAIAVQSLNGNFSKAVPLTAELTTTSTHALLSSVSSLQDFGAVIVITDDSENARVWIEQIQPQIAETPLLMVTSAQAAPLIQPYYQSGQVAGLVSGMTGSLVYERVMQTPGDSAGHLSSLQILSVLMAGLILVGGFISMVKPVEIGGTG